MVKEQSQLCWEARRVGISKHYRHTCKHTYTNTHTPEKPSLTLCPLDARGTHRIAIWGQTFYRLLTQHTLQTHVSSGVPWHSKPILESLIIFNVAKNPLGQTWNYSEFGPRTSRSVPRNLKWEMDFLEWLQVLGVHVWPRLLNIWVLLQD